MRSRKNQKTINKIAVDFPVAFMYDYNEDFLLE